MDPGTKLCFARDDGVFPSKIVFANGSEAAQSR